MLNRLRGFEAAIDMPPRESLFAAGLTIGFALMIAGGMIVGSDSISPLVKTIALTMFPGVLVLPSQWVYLRGRSTAVRVILIGGPFVVLFLIGLVAGLVISD